MTVFAACHFCTVEQSLIECADGKNLCDECYMERLTHEWRDATRDELLQALELVTLPSGECAWLRPEQKS